MNSEIAVIGAAGFVGRRLVPLLLSGPAVVRVLVHRRAPVLPAGAAGVRLVRGDLALPDSLSSLFEGAATVFDLAPGTAPALRSSMVERAAAAGVRRLVHCSSAVVVGRTSHRRIDEGTACRPWSPYERLKYEGEEAVRAAARGRLACVIVRPTRVFGEGGRNLVTHCARLRRGGWTVRLHAALNGRRRMNLVSVETVAAALGFLAHAPLPSADETYHVAEDDEPANDYAGVETLLRRGLGLAPSAHAWSPPPHVLRAALWARGRSDGRGDRVYDAGKLAAVGFRKPLPFEEAVVGFARGFRAASVPAATERA